MVNPHRFYTYAYLRNDKTPYYVGKGSGKRAYTKSKKRIKPPKDKSRIIFLKQNLTEEEAFKHEKYMISVFGRKDLGTGILHNRTNGGEGASGAIRSIEFKEHLRKINENKILSEEHKEKLKKSNTGQNNPNYGKSASKETREKMSKSHTGEKHSHSNWWRLTFLDKNTLILCGLNTWARNNGYSVGNIYAVYKGSRKSHKDIIKVEKIIKSDYVASV
jgi:hypothetical protein